MVCALVITSSYLVCCRFVLFRSWGRVGTDIGGNKTDVSVLLVVHKFVFTLSVEAGALVYEVCMCNPVVHQSCGWQ